MLGTGNDPAENQRIDSWKEIATFFGRDERTVKRWEKERLLPVHRIPGGERGRVFAYTHELTRWMNTPPHVKGHPEQPPLPAPFEPIIEKKSEEPVQSVAAADSVVEQAGASRAWKAWAVVLAGVVLSVFFIVRFSFPGAHRIVHQSKISQKSVRYIQNAEAEEFYLRGRYYWNRRTGDSLKHAVDEFTQAIVHDPSDAKAYAGLADSYNLMREYTSMPDSEAYPRAIAAASKAVALDNNLAEAHRALAFALFYGKWDVPNALKEYQKAIQLDPKDAEAHHWYATALLNLGQFDESLLEIERARRLDPTSPSILADRGLILFHAGDPSHAIAALREVEQTEPQFLSPPRYLARLYLQQKDYPGFLGQMERAASISKDADERAIATAARRGWSAGGKHKMLEEMERAQQATFESGKSSGFDLAYTCLLLGQKKSATRYLQAAYLVHDPNVLSVARGRFEADLKGDPSFEQLKANLQTYGH